MVVTVTQTIDQDTAELLVEEFGHNIVRVSESDVDIDNAADVDAAQVRSPNGRVTDRPDERTIRYYATIGLLDRASGNRGRTSLYGERHLLQLVAIKRRQAQGRTLAEIQTELVGATDRTLRGIAGITPSFAPVAAPMTMPVAAPDAPARAFWNERPATTPPGLFYGVPLGHGVVVQVPNPPTAADVESIRAAAQPLLDLLARRSLTEPEKGSTA